MCRWALPRILGRSPTIGRPERNLAPIITAATSGLVAAKDPSTIGLVEAMRA
jgi:hypothetical protein